MLHFLSIERVEGESVVGVRVSITSDWDLPVSRPYRRRPRAVSPFFSLFLNRENGTQHRYAYQSRIVRIGASATYYTGTRRSWPYRCFVGLWYNLVILSAVYGTLIFTLAYSFRKCLRNYIYLCVSCCLPHFC